MYPMTRDKKYAHVTETVWAVEWETRSSGECVKYYVGKADAENVAGLLRADKDVYSVKVSSYPAHYVYGRLNPDETSVLL